MIERFIMAGADVYRFEEYRVVVDGLRLVIAAPCRGEAAESPYPSPVTASFLVNVRERVQAIEHLPLSPLPAPNPNPEPYQKKVVACRYCLRKTCDECKGYGKVDCEKCGSEISCNKCAEKGYIAVGECKECHGRRELTVGADIDIDGFMFDGEIIGLMHETLSNVRRAGPRHGLLHFCADGDVWGRLRAIPSFHYH